MVSSRSTLATLLATMLVACTPAPSPSDASDATAGDVVMDATDVFVPWMSPLFGRCRMDADCPEGSLCLRNTDGYPGGFCTRICTSDDDCNPGIEGVSGVCQQVGNRRLCMRQCLNGFDCGREGYTCVGAQYGRNTIDPGVCQPSCDMNNCGSDARCNFWTGRCEPLTAPSPPPGNDNGQPCSMSGMGSECRSSICIRATNTQTGAATGWNNGSCVSICSLPPGYSAGAFWPEEEFPRGNCPEGSICFPTESLAERDEGLCLRACRTDRDCRTSEGYYCRRTFTRGMRPYTWQNGVCLPVDCLNDRDHPCPSGYVCETQYRMVGTMRVSVGVCRPAPPMPDAGSDGSTLDASMEGSTPDAGTSTDSETVPDAGLDVAKD